MNLELVTASPIWNQAKMKDHLKAINFEKDKQNTFNTPAPNPRFLSNGLQKRNLEV